MIKKFIQFLLLLMWFTNLKSQEKGRPPHYTDPALRDFFPSNLLVNYTVRIVGQNDSTINGKKIRTTSTGTGFFYEFKIDTTSLFVLVTNKHVVEHSTIGYLSFKENGALPFNAKRVSHSVSIPNFKNKWIYHPNDDLAILPLNSIIEDYYRLYKKGIQMAWLNKNSIPEAKDSFTVSSVEKIVMVGYPKGLWDSTNNFPVIRQGLTATPYWNDFNGQKRFLIDIPIFSGSSGSPVFLYSFDPYPVDTTMLNAGEIRFYLLGITVESLNYNAEGNIVSASSDSLNSNYRVVTSLPINIAKVIKAEVLQDFIPLIKQYLLINQRTKRN